MGISLRDFQDFVLLWLQNRTGVHDGELRVYPAMVRHCLCCQVGGTYAHRTNGLCLKCCDEQDCILCKETFTPSDDSVGPICVACWSKLETSWTTTFQEPDPAKAEGDLRSVLTAAKPRLTGCQHRG